MSPDLSAEALPSRLGAGALTAKTKADARSGPRELGHLRNRPGCRGRVRALPSAAGSSGRAPVSGIVAGAVLAPSRSPRHARAYPGLNAQRARPLGNRARLDQRPSARYCAGGGVCCGVAGGVAGMSSPASSHATRNSAPRRPRVAMISCRMRLLPWPGRAGRSPALRWLAVNREPSWPAPVTRRERRDHQVVPLPTLPWSFSARSPRTGSAEPDAPQGG